VSAHSGLCIVAVFEKLDMLWLWTVWAETVSCRGFHRAASRVGPVPQLRRNPGSGGYDGAPNKNSVTQAQFEQCAGSFRFARDDRELYDWAWPLTG
jgi:hypothetical protein